MPVLHTITLLLLLSLGACQSTDELSTTGQPPGPGPFPTTGTPVFGSPGGEPTPSVDPSPDLTVLAVSSDPVVQAPPDLGTSCPSGGEASLTFSPPNPRVGERVTVTVAAPEALTNLVVTFPPSSADPLVWGQVTPTGSGYRWTWSTTPRTAGPLCVRLTADPASTSYGAALLVVQESQTVQPQPPATGGRTAFKVSSNHQWTCEEEFTWAIVFEVRVEDEQGQGLEGVSVTVGHNDCELAEDHPPPAVLVTGADGKASFENYNPGSIRDYPTNTCKFFMEVAGQPSDRAVELTTGIWEDQDTPQGKCNFCSTFAENVWGHWSYTVVFRRTPGATERCEVPTDHAGQAHCSPTLHFYEPGPCTPL